MEESTKENFSALFVGLLFLTLLLGTVIVFGLLFLLIDETPCR